MYDLARMLSGNSSNMLNSNSESDDGQVWTAHRV